MNANFIKDFCRYKKYQYLTNKKKKFLNNNQKDFENTFEIKSIKKNLKNRGYHVIKNFFSKNECSYLINEMNEFIKSNPKLIWQDNKKSDNRIFGAENISIKFNEKVKKFTQLSKKVGEKYLQYEIDLFMIMANRIDFKEANLGSGSGWHLDSYNKQFKSIIYLNDVNKQNGAFQIIKKSNTNFFILNMFRKLKNKFPSTRFTEEEIFSLDIKKEDFEELNYPAGTLIFVDTSNLHRGKPLLSGSRYALTSYFFSKDTFDDHSDHFKPKLKKLES